MRKIDRPGSFRRDYKRGAKGRYRATLDDELLPVLKTLVTDQPLDARYRDHPLIGDWKGFRECHIKPDLLIWSTGKTMIICLSLPALGHTANFSVKAMVASEFIND